jgi:hypothetical protein
MWYNRHIIKKRCKRRKKMKEFRNANGRVYNVLKESGRYALLQDKNREEYVIAIGIGEKDWDHGRYYHKSEDAKSEWDELVGE